MPALSRNQIPSFLTDHPEFQGIFYGECIGHEKPSQSTVGHSHVNPNDPNHGWICIASKTLTKDKQLLKHELAHILVGRGHGHDDTWRKMVLKLGGHLNEYTFKYDKRRPGVNIPCFHKVCMTRRGKKS
jgi:hypothetical protein